MKQIEDVDELNLFGTPEYTGFKFVYTQAIDPDFAEKLVDSIK